MLLLCIIAGIVLFICFLLLMDFVSSIVGSVLALFYVGICLLFNLKIKKVGK